MRQYPRFRHGKHSRFTRLPRARLPYTQTELKDPVTVVERNLAVDGQFHKNSDRVCFPVLVNFFIRTYSALLFTTTGLRMIGVLRLSP